MTKNIIEPLDEAGCWELLEGHEFGRLAFSVANEPDIVPLNFCARDQKVYFRTGSGSKLLAMTINQKVAFEFDLVEDGIAKSVIIYGTAREMDDESEREFFESLPLRPWVATHKYHYLEITPREIHGRLFHLGELEED